MDKQTSPNKQDKVHLQTVIDKAYCIACYISSHLFIPLASKVSPLSIRYASLALRIQSRDEMHDF